MTEKPKATSGEVCPFHKKDVSKVCHRCPLWIQLRGTHPQTGQDLDEWGCSLYWAPILMIETRMGLDGTQKAIELFRDEFLKSQSSLLLNLLEMKDSNQKDLKIVTSMKE